MTAGKVQFRKLTKLRKDQNNARTHSAEQTETIAASDWCHVRPGMTASELWRDELFPMGIRLLVRVIRDLGEGRMVKVPQDEACATWEPSWHRPPAERPDLPQLTNGTDPIAERFEVVTNRSAA